MLPCQAPVVTCSAEVERVGPPKHGVRSIRLRVVALDACQGAVPRAGLTVTVRSNGTERAGGHCKAHSDTNGRDGHGAAVNITESLVGGTVPGEFLATLRLRAERDAKGFDRSYTIEVTAVDTAGNAARSGCSVSVPRKRGSMK